MKFPIDSQRLLLLPIKTIVTARSAYSQGTANDFYSEADYWWPVSSAPGSPYASRDGLSNPACFNRHRQLLLRMSCHAAGLAEAFLDRHDRRFIRRAAEIFDAWFVTPETAMRPHLKYAQAIRGRCAGRNFGVIDTIHLAEVALVAELLAPELPERISNGVRNWFRSYLQWLCESELGRAERHTNNNHAVCWYLQSAAFARLTGDQARLAEFRHDFQHILLAQIAPDGSLPEELARSKPYGYSLFTTEAFAGLAALLSTPRENFFFTAGPHGQRLADCMEYIVPYIVDKSSWPRPPDVLYDHCWPSRQAALYLAAEFMQRPDYRTVWEKLPEPRPVFELFRNLPIRHPRLWLEQCRSQNLCHTLTEMENR